MDDGSDFDGDDLHEEDDEEDDDDSLGVLQGIHISRPLYYILCLSGLLNKALLLSIRILLGKHGKKTKQWSLGILS